MSNELQKKPATSKAKLSAFDSELLLIVAKTLLASNGLKSINLSPIFIDHYYIINVVCKNCYNYKQLQQQAASEHFLCKSYG